MSIEDSSAFQADCLQDANASLDDLGDGAWAVEAAPRTPAWRLSPTVAGYRCPNCQGLHYANVPRFGGGIVTRTLPCEPEFQTNAYRAVNLDIRPERPPGTMQAVFDKALPKEDLYNCYRLIAAGTTTSSARLVRYGDDDENAWTPTRENIQLALRRLAECGALDEARSLRMELAGLGGRAAWRASAADVWRRADGKTFRQKLANALKDAWRDMGR